MTERPLWDSMDELGFQMGDMNGEWEAPVATDKDKPKLPILPKLVEKPLVVPPVRQAPVERKHITRSGK